MSQRPGSERFSFAMMLGAIFAAGVGYGIYAKQKGYFPVPQVNAGLNAVKALRAETQRKWFVGLPARAPEVETSGQPSPGNVMLVGVEEGPRNMVRVIDRGGAVLHHWTPDWFSIWGAEGDIPASRRPKSQPGAILHGALLMDNGDLVVNFEHLSTVRLNACGDVVWKHDNLGHHSLFEAEDGTIWTSAERYLTSGATDHAKIATPYHAWTAQQIAPDGTILQTIDVTEVLARNDLSGLMHLASINNLDTTVRGDTLHLNDVEIFPASAKSDLFAPGDLMLSLRNINTIMVIDPATLAIKWRETGGFLRQHDPDFRSDGSILLFDNNNLSTEHGDGSSRILRIVPETGEKQVLFEGTTDTPFYTAIMGKQQSLDGGGIMVTSSLEGRAIEIDAAGQPVWSYNNQATPEFNALLTEATVLPQWADKAFFEARRAACATPG